MPITPMPEAWSQVLASSKSLAKLVSSMFDQRPCLGKKRKEKESKVRHNRKTVSASGLHTHMHLRHTIYQDKRNMMGVSSWCC